jgi:hypothetical protein
MNTQDDPILLALHDFEMHGHVPDEETIAALAQRRTETMQLHGRLTRCLDEIHERRSRRSPSQTKSYSHSEETIAQDESFD